jgi:hypothetical protein
MKDKDYFICTKKLIKIYTHLVMSKIPVENRCTCKKDDNKKSGTL